MEQKQFAAKYKQVRYDTGLCIECGSLRDDERIFCASCRQRKSQRDKDRRVYNSSRRQCTRCSNVLEEDMVGLVCRDCWFRNMAAVSLKSQRRWNELKELFEKQGGRCFYSDEILVPGVNASIDHKLPQCRGGDNRPENIQWVTSDINRVKGKKTHEEFVEMCRHIAEKFS